MADNKNSLTKDEMQAKLQRKVAQLKSDLEQAGSPASLTVEVIGGTLSGWGVTRAIYSGLDFFLKVQPGEAPGRIKAHPEFTKGVVAGTLGLLGGIASLALPYRYPMSYPRGMTLQGACAMLTSGLDRVVDNFPKAAQGALPPAGK